MFALSLCGLFLHKAWWVLAIIVAFTNWRQIGLAMSNVIRRGYSWHSEDDYGFDKPQIKLSVEK